MKVTRTDVAKLAGVSTATVSYVLNGSRSMSEKTRKLVLDAVEQLNYKPDMIARSMTKNETRQLSFMVNDATNPFYGEIIVGFENAAMERGYFVNICTGNKNINDYFDNYIARRVDGVFIAAIPYKFDMAKLYSLTDNGIRVVVSGNTDVDLKRVSSIESDYVTAMDKAVSYLYGLGHREISYLSGLSRKFQFDHRIDGYLAAVERYQLPCGSGSAVRRQTAVSHRDRRGLCADAGTAKVGTPVHSRHLPERSDGNGARSPRFRRRACACRRMFPSWALTTFSFRRRGGLHHDNGSFKGGIRQKGV